MKSLRIYFTIWLFTVILSGCSPDLPIVPPINQTATNEFHPGKFIWRDLMTHDINSVKKFYSELFGWTYLDIGKSDNDYTVIMYNGKPIAGMYKLRDADVKQNYSQWVSYLSVADMNQAVNYIKANGGRIYRDPFELPNRGTIAFIFDSQQAIVALVKSSSGDPADQEPVYNQWFWNELWTNDVQNSVKFYSDLFGYKERKFDTQAGNQYHVLEMKEKPRAGVVKIPFENVKPHWMPYIAVKDPKEIVKKVEQLGGTVYLGTEGIAGNNAAIIADPSGAVFTVQKWPLEAGKFKENKNEK